MRNVYVLVEGGGAKGMGHIIRQYSLCTLLGIEKSVTVLIVTDVTENDFPDLDNNFPKRALYNNLSEALSAVPAGSLLFVDGYHFDPAELNSNKINKKLQIIFVADINDNIPNCEVLINHLPWADEKQFKDANISLKLSGPGYAILRKPFYERKERRPQDRLLICLGSGEVSAEIRAIYEALIARGFSKEQIDILYHRKIAGVDVCNFHFDLSAESIAEMIGNAKLCFITPGNISYEVFSINRPVILGSVAEGQKEVAAGFYSLGLGYYIGDWKSADFNQLDTWIDHAQASKNIQKFFFKSLRKENIPQQLASYLN